MSTVEQLIPLADQDRAILIAKKRHHLRYTILEALGSVAVLLPLILVQTLYCLIALPFFSLILAVTAVGSLLNFLSVKKDLAQGQKIAFKGQVEDQNVDVSRQKDRHGSEGAASYKFWVKAGGRKLTVTEEQYYQVKKGDQIEVQIAPHSETIFGITKQ
jgi:hypothetical protein